MKKILIVSEGYGFDTKIVHDDEEATPIPYVTGADVRIRADEVVTVELEMHLPTLSVKGIVKKIDYSCPVCNEHMTHECAGPETLGQPKPCV